MENCRVRKHWDDIGCLRRQSDAVDSGLIGVSLETDRIVCAASRRHAWLYEGIEPDISTLDVLKESVS